MIAVRVDDAHAAPALTHVIIEVIPYLAEAGVLTPLDAFVGDADLGLVPELAQARGFAGGDARPLVGLPWNRSGLLGQHFQDHRFLFSQFLDLAVPRSTAEGAEVDFVTGELHDVSAR